MQSALLYGAKNIRIEEVEIPPLSQDMVLLKIKRAGICGSDLHYFEDGYCGGFVPSQPFILGHELTAEIVSLHESSSVNSLVIGTRVTVNPARACGVCNYCKGGLQNLCKSTIMLGSGSTIPPTNGAFAEYIVVRTDQCHILPQNVTDEEGAMIEPLAVALQAIKQADGVSGKRILVTGGGTIGLLTAVLSKSFGAVLVAVSDVTTERREKALTMSIDSVIDPTDSQISTLTGEGFDVIFEASGANVALRQAFDLIMPGGTIVQIGTIGTKDVPLPANLIMVKQIRYIGSFRYANIFDEAISLVASGRIDLKPFISSIFPFNKIIKAFEVAADKANSLKVQIKF